MAIVSGAGGEGGMQGVAQAMAEAGTFADVIFRVLVKRGGDGVFSADFREEAAVFGAEAIAETGAAFAPIGRFIFGLQDAGYRDGFHQCVGADRFPHEVLPLLAGRRARIGGGRR